MDGTIAGIVQKFGVLGTGGEKILWALIQTGTTTSLLFGNLTMRKIFTL